MNHIWPSACAARLRSVMRFNAMRANTANALYALPSRSWSKPGFYGYSDRVGGIGGRELFKHEHAVHLNRLFA